MSDIDSDRERTCLRAAGASLRRRQVVIRVEQGKGRKDRYAMLSPALPGPGARAILRP